ncbi:hypothetical protein RLEG12_30480 [Rhizobium leguminosarum bv. trifolii CB782]|nr:hypothetical protein RLEG12_30480 [Rhizobium leguminosarum bv. trifolii CB782]
MRPPTQRLSVVFFEDGYQLMDSCQNDLGGVAQGVKSALASEVLEVQRRRQPVLENRFLPSKVFDIYPASHNANNQKHGEIARDIGACHG